MKKSKRDNQQRKKGSQKQPAFKLNKYLKSKAKEVDSALKKWLPKKHNIIESLYSAMRHSMLSGGKRLRPILVLAAAEACQKASQDLMPAALALECIHTYSLIHDDLPAMDNDDLRRGKPTCHKVYGEATAILAGDALLTYAFELMPKARLSGARPAQRLVDAIALLAHAAGMNGMVGGQVADIQSEGRDIDFPTLQYIHTHKTGYLIMAACRIGALLAGGTAKQIHALTVYGESLGLAFQIIDDILNVVGDPEKLGKQTGTDSSRAKATYPSLLGLEESRNHAGILIDQACEALKPLGESAEPLIALAQYVMKREV